MPDDQWADDEWGEDLDTPMPSTKTHIPRYVWNCGIGCLVFVVLSGIALWFFGSKLMDFVADQDAQWAALQEHVDVEQPESGWELFRIPVVHRAQDLDVCWHVSVDDPVAASGFLVVGSDPGAQAVRRGLMQPNTTVDKYEFAVTSADRYGVERGSITIAGREINLLRFQGSPPDERDPDWYPDPDLEGQPEGSFGDADVDSSEGGGTRFRVEHDGTEARGAGVTLDLSEEGEGLVLMLQLTKITETEPWDQADLERVLRPFLPGLSSESSEESSEEPSSGTGR